MSVYHAGGSKPAPEPVAALAVSEAAAARLLSLSPRTLWGLRRTARGPRHVRIGGSIRYSVAELRRWLNEQASTAEGGAN